MNFQSFLNHQYPSRTIDRASLNSNKWSREIDRAWTNDRSRAKCDFNQMIELEQIIDHEKSQCRTNNRSRSKVLFQNDVRSRKSDLRQIIYHKYSIIFKLSKCISNNCLSEPNHEQVISKQLIELEQMVNLFEQKSISNE
jgi:hypothetical protein